MAISEGNRIWGQNIYDVLDEDGNEGPVSEAPSTPSQNHPKPPLPPARPFISPLSTALLENSLSFQTGGSAALQSVRDPQQDNSLKLAELFEKTAFQWETLPKAAFSSGSNCWAENLKTPFAKLYDGETEIGLGFKIQRIQNMSQSLFLVLLSSPLVVKLHSPERQLLSASEEFPEWEVDDCGKAQQPRVMFERLKSILQGRDHEYTTREPIKTKKPLPEREISVPPSSALWTTVRKALLIFALALCAIVATAWMVRSRLLQNGSKPC